MDILKCHKKNGEWEGTGGGLEFGSEPSVSQAFWVLTFRRPCQLGHTLPL